MALFQSTLGNPNLRRFFLGQGISNIGNLLKQVAIAWMAYKLTDSARLLAVVLFSREIAAFLISPLAGVIADRLDKFRLILLANTALMFTTTFLGLAVIWNLADIYFLIGIQFLFGLISGTEIPTRQAFVNELVEKKENLTNAIALNSTLFNTARIVGPSVAGILIPLVGEGVCFLIYGGMLALLLIIFWPIKYQKPEDPPKRANFKTEMKNGWNYAIQSPNLRPLLLITAWVTFFGLSYEMLLPVFADRVFDGVFEANAITFGYLASAVGAGSIFGAVLLAQRKNLIGLEKIL
ncbi:MAG: MFS transporter, partial [Bacteroidota bacterium]